MIALGLSSVLVALFVWRRRRRAAKLAGLDGGTPTYTVAPPTRRLGSRRDEVL